MSSEDVRIYPNFITAMWHESQLQGIPLVVMMAIAEHADANGWVYDVTAEDIAYKTGTSIRNVRHHIKELEIDGYLCIDRYPGKASAYFVGTLPDMKVKYENGPKQWL